MSVFSTNGVEAIGSNRENVVLKPPFLLLNTTVFLGLVAAVFFLVDSRVGYLAGTVASVAGGLVAFVNLKRMSDPNYVSFTWFLPLLRTVRYAVLLITAGHIVKLAVDAATGASLL